jgi:hypothetical protein
MGRTSPDAWPARPHAQTATDKSAIGNSRNAIDPLRARKFQSGSTTCGFHWIRCKAINRANCNRYRISSTIRPATLQICSHRLA